MISKYTVDIPIVVQWRHEYFMKLLLNVKVVTDILMIDSFIINE